MADSSRNLIKIFNPVLAAVKTYRCSTQVIKIGSGDSVDLQIFLPSLQAEHIVVDLDEQKVTAIGNDVHCNTAPLSPGSSSHFNNDSVIRIHNIFMGFYKPNDTFSSSACDKKLILAASQYKEFSPVFRIVHCKCQDGDDFIENGIVTGDSEIQTQTSSAMSSLYEKEVGDVFAMPSILPEDSQNLSPSSKAIEGTRKEFEEVYHVKPSDEILEAAIEKKIEAVSEKTIEVLEGTVDIPLVRQTHGDLGAMAIDNSILQKAKTEIQEGADRDRILEAEINSVDMLKNRITDNIKDEMRESISKVVQEEVQDKVDTAVKECIQSSKITDAIAEQVTEKVLENEALDERIMKARISGKVDEDKDDRHDSVAMESQGTESNENDESASMKKRKSAAAKRKSSEHSEDGVGDTRKNLDGRKKRKAAIAGPEETGRSNVKSKNTSAKSKEPASKKKRTSSSRK